LADIPRGSEEDMLRAIAKNKLFPTTRINTIRKENAKSFVLL
jgi:hypothetical protein